MDVRGKIKGILDKIPIYDQETDFKKIYKDYARDVKYSPLEEGLDLRNLKVKPLMVLSRKPSSPPRDQYVIVAEVGKPLQLFGYDIDGKEIVIDSIQVRTLLRPLDDAIKIGQGNRNDSEDKLADLKKLIENNMEEIKKKNLELNKLMPEKQKDVLLRPKITLEQGREENKKFKERLERKKVNKPKREQLQREIMALEDENMKYGKQKNEIGIRHGLNSTDNNERINAINASPILEEIRVNLSASTIKDAATVEVAEKVVGPIKAIEVDWKELKKAAEDSGRSEIELLTDHFSGMSANEREANKSKLVTFKRAVDKMPGATPPMKQIVSDMSKALALSELNSKERIVYQHTLEIIHAMKTNDIKKVVLATERFGHFLSEPENTELKIDEMKSVKKLLAKEMPVSSAEVIEIMKKAVPGDIDNSFQKRMTLASDALSSLCYKPAKLKVERLAKGMKLSELKLATSKIPCVFIIEDKKGNLSGCYVAGDGTQNPFEITSTQKKYVDKHFEESRIFKMKDKSSNSKEFINSLAVMAESNRVKLKAQGSIKVEEAKKFIEKSLIQNVEQRKSIEKLIENLERECREFKKDAAKDRAMLLVKELRQHVTEYYSKDINLFSHTSFSDKCKKSIEAAQKDIDKNATPGWRGALEDFKYFLSKLTVAKSKAADSTPNPYTFYEVNIKSGSSYECC